MAGLPRWGRLTMPATGVLSAALFLWSGFTSNVPMYGDSVVDYARWATAHQLAAGRDLALLFVVYLMNLLFGIYVATLVGGRGPWPEVLARIALVAIGVRFAFEFLQISLLAVPSSGNIAPFDEAMARWVSMLPVFSLLPNVMFLVAVGVTALASGATSRWLAWLTVGVGAVQITYLVLGLLGVTANPVLIAFAAVWYLSIPGWPLVAGLTLFVSAIRRPSPASQLVPSSA